VERFWDLKLLEAARESQRVAFCYDIRACDEKAGGVDLKNNLE